VSEMRILAERLLQLANDEGTAQIHDVAIEISRLVGFQEREMERLRAALAATAVPVTEFPLDAGLHNLAFPEPTAAPSDDVKWADWDGAVNTDQPIFDAIAAATSIDTEPDGFPRIVMSASKFIETFNNHRDRDLCASLKCSVSRPEPAATPARDAIARALAKKWPGDYAYGDPPEGPNEMAFETADIALAAAPQAQEGWQPIGTAPKDGSVMLLDYDGNVIIGGFNPGEGWTTGDGDYIPEKDIRGWMARPTPVSRPEPAATPTPEPVAWRFRAPDRRAWTYDDLKPRNHANFICEPLYAVAQTEREHGWLIEWPEDDNVPVRWWNPATGWVRDANNAMRFCRERDAADYIAAGHWAAGMKPTEHIFLSPVSLPLRGTP
jgi:hypothetical protein